MQLSDLDFNYPESLIATERESNSRVGVVDMRTPGDNFADLEKIEDLFKYFRAGDILVVNDTKVLSRRLFTHEGFEVLFIRNIDENRWLALSPTSRWKNKTQTLPEGVEVRVLQPGRPGIIETNRKLNEDYFSRNGEMPIPPYILKARNEKHARGEDKKFYQTAWSEKPGSLASPTASLHFSANHLQALKSLGVKIETITLHVGLGTFLPITSESLKDHEMHFEWAEVSENTLSKIYEVKNSSGRVWALGTTATRALESVAGGLLQKTGNVYLGDTNLFIFPPYEFKIVDCLLTNFHQPRTTLLALVTAFANGDLHKVKTFYNWAIEKKFRLFSYGDLTAWIKK